jgi:ABC-type uncharacterized transport system permease subunit
MALRAAAVPWRVHTHSLSFISNFGVLIISHIFILHICALISLVSVIVGRNIAQLIAKRAGVSGINDTFEVSTRIPLAAHLNALRKTLLLVITVALATGFIHGYVYQRAALTAATRHDTLNFLRLYLAAYVFGFWIEWSLYQWGVVTSTSTRHFAIMTLSEVLAGISLAIGHSLIGE